MLKHGVWKYYYENGVVSSIEKYKKSKAVNATYFDRNGVIISRELQPFQDATFPEGEETMVLRIQKNLIYPYNGVIESNFYLKCFFRIFEL